jgi:hypothetical protein
MQVQGEETRIKAEVDIPADCDKFEAIYQPVDAGHADERHAVIDWMIFNTYQ